MVRWHNRLLIAFHVISDSSLGLLAFMLAYALRFQTGLIPVTKGFPPLRQYIDLMPFIAILVPLAFQLQGLYRLRRGRSRVDDFFAVFVGSILAVVFGIVATLYVQAYFADSTARYRGAYQVSQPLWAIFIVINTGLTYSSRVFVREMLERRWRAGIGLKRILIAGSGELGRLVADKILEHRELGYQIVGFVDDRAAGDHLGYRGLPLLGNSSNRCKPLRFKGFNRWSWCRSTTPRWTSSWWAAGAARRTTWRRSTRKRWCARCNPSP